MKICINVESHVNDTKLRLQKDGSWARCFDPAILKPGDYTTSNRKELMDFQVFDREVILDGQLRIVFPDKNADMDEELDLYYKLYGFRNFVPDNPCKQQLDSLFLKADDSKRNVLVLKTDGLFDFMEESVLGRLENDPDLVLMFDVPEAGTNFTGAGMPAGSFEGYIFRYYVVAMSYWMKHLAMNQLHMFSQNETDYVDLDYLLDIIDCLKSFREIQSFRKQYGLEESF
ncbi:MAG: hypothetical protein EOO01_43170 [Chitinophagaceae bacterium]|nr:MAG: hypothetical protein EOO01_43170 [Chitinophagaceae bacterium]